MLWSAGLMIIDAVPDGAFCASAGLRRVRRLGLTPDVDWSERVVRAGRDERIRLRTPAAGDGGRDPAGMAVPAAHASDGAGRVPGMPGIQRGISAAPTGDLLDRVPDDVILEGAGRCQPGFGLVVCDGYGSCGVMAHHRVTLGTPTSVRGSAATR